MHEFSHLHVLVAKKTILTSGYPTKNFFAVVEEKKGIIE